ncbi:hypothetical protein L917_06836 [Phytophthora nicotianae]|uniref:Uncharacterized protein n=1 Tax=Phytophthora nicotianae TaxID=4792 RepID=W2LD02_PHYNI|nr:hypothetical protein L917_06836 [Phytophthora nicotianae]
MCSRLRPSKQGPAHFGCQEGSDEHEVPTIQVEHVLFVAEKAHSHLANKVEREGGDTSGILGNIRLGLAFLLKQRTGSLRIMELKPEHVQHVRESQSHNQNFVLLRRRTNDVDPPPDLLLHNNPT